ncbi:hypothetical protein RMO66_00945 [Nocardia seriolae]|nr:hypothetical protein [Nocardia seriolae]WNJ59462.1 hypothetical protein RMO66_00945 [Nocardia seriolae]
MRDHPAQRFRWELEQRLQVVLHRPVVDAAVGLRAEELPPQRNLGERQRDQRGQQHGRGDGAQRAQPGLRRVQVVDERENPEGQRENEQRLLAQRDLQGHQQTQDEGVAIAARLAYFLGGIGALGHPDELQRDQRKQGQHHEIRVRVGVRDHGRGEAAEQAAHGRRELGRDRFAGEQPVPGEGGAEQAQGEHQHEGDGRPEQQGDRRQRHADTEHGGIGHHVHAVGIVLQQTAERVLQVRHIVRGDGEEPLPHGLVLAALDEVAAIGVQPLARQHQHRQRQVRGGHDQIGTRQP